MGQVYEKIIEVIENEGKFLREDFYNRNNYV